MDAIAWKWRDGSIHLEVKLTAFHDENGEMFCHLDGEKSHLFETACGKKWWGIGSSSGYGHSERISCPDCRKILEGARFRIVAEE